VLGGVITSGLGWRWCLYLNIVFSVFAVLGAPRVLPQIPGRPEARIDVASALFASLGMVGLVYGLGEAASAGGARAGSSVRSLVPWFCWEGSSAASSATPIGCCPLRVVSDRNRGGGMVALIVNALSTFAMMLILTYQLQSVMDYSALKTGLALGPLRARCCARLGVRRRRS
jgi:hypothetical protein